MLAVEGSYSSSPELHRDHSRFFLAIGYLGVAGILLAGRSCTWVVGRLEPIMLA